MGTTRGASCSADTSAITSVLKMEENAGEISDHKYGAKLIMRDPKVEEER